MKALEVTSLQFSYPDKIQVLDAITFSVMSDEHVGLIGPNGAGKSTLLLHLNGLLPASRTHESAVRIFGWPVCEPHLARIRASVGFLFQDPDDQLFCSTVWEDVAFGPQQMALSQAEVQRRVSQALEAVGLLPLADRPPHHLSRGEKRRACLAGLLACQCQCLVLDEPTSDLDPRGRRELAALLKKTELTQVIATHDLTLAAELCSRIILLDQGRIIADGPSAQILSDRSLLDAHGLA